VTGCTTTARAPVSNKSKPPPTANTKPYSQAQANIEKPDSNTRTHSGYHIVVKGDTLYSIAWRYDHDYKDFAKWNDIVPPYVIYPGQLIRLKPAPEKKQKTAAKVPVKHKPEVRKQKQATTSSKPSLPKIKERTVSTGPIKWQWPAQGKLVKSNTPTSKKGIDISGKIGQQIKASANGVVVYSGSGLLGYGKLIIIKHNDTFLSAYAYNSKLLVQEGDFVKTGQRIAAMGQGNNDRAMLHFEIRKNGKPANPLDFLPNKQS
jgi:lipoprotein NlpD